MAKSGDDMRRRGADYWSRFSEQALVAMIAVAHERANAASRYAAWWVGGAFVSLIGLPAALTSSELGFLVLLAGGCGIWKGFELRESHSALTFDAMDMETALARLREAGSRAGIVLAAGDSTTGR